MKKNQSTKTFTRFFYVPLHGEYIKKNYPAH